MKKNTSWKFTDELSVTFQSSVSGAGEFGLSEVGKDHVKHLEVFVGIMKN